LVKYQINYFDVLLLLLINNKMKSPTPKLQIVTDYSPESSSEEESNNSFKSLIKDN